MLDPNSMNPEIEGSTSNSSNGDCPSQKTRLVDHQPPNLAASIQLLATTQQQQQTLLTKIAERLDQLQISFQQRQLPSTTSPPKVPPRSLESLQPNPTIQPNHPIPPQFLIFILRVCV